MKKLIIPIVIIFALLIAITSYAVKTKNLTDTMIKKVTITIDQEGENWTANVAVQGDVFDEFGGLDQQQHMYANRKDLPANVRDKLDDFLKHLAIEFNKQMADENQNPLPPLN